MSTVLYILTVREYRKNKSHIMRPTPVKSYIRIIIPDITNCK